MKLNLLPDYVTKRKINTQVMVALALVWLLVSAGLGFMYVQKNSELAQRKEDADRLKITADNVDAIVSQARSKVSAIQEIVDRVRFIADAAAWNTKYAELYNEIRAYTSPRVRYESMKVNQGNTLEITAVAKTIPDIGLYLQTMYNCPRLAAVQLASSTEGYRPAGQASDTAPGAAGGFGGGGGGAVRETQQSGPMRAGVSGGGGPAGGPAPSAPGGGLSSFTSGTSGQAMEILPTGVRRFQIVCLLTQPMTPPAPPGTQPDPNQMGGVPGMGNVMAGGGGAPPAGAATAGGGDVGNEDEFEGGRRGGGG
ncbi:MAG: hypothetical protein HUU60_08085 [Armatimonadetes bacterium]|nr:hypothetical protein [Armatimonadota bacterium]